MVVGLSDGSRHARKTRGRLRGRPRTVPSPALLPEPRGFGLRPCVEHLLDLGEGLFDGVVARSIAGRVRQNSQPCPSISSLTLSPACERAGCPYDQYLPFVQFGKEDPLQVGLEDPRGGRALHRESRTHPFQAHPSSCSPARSCSCLGCAVRVAKAARLRGSSRTREPARYGCRTHRRIPTASDRVLRLPSPSRRPLRTRRVLGPSFPLFPGGAWWSSSALWPGTRRSGSPPRRPPSADTRAFVGG
jgi:hypothetical protein